MSGKKRVLLVEDNERLNEINSRALRMAGYIVHPALTLAEARELLANSEPDAIVLDILLPDGNGVDFCREIREGTAAPILFLTAVTGYEEAMEGLAAGGDDYLSKPFDIDMLIAKVGAFLRRDEIAKRIQNPPRMLTQGSLALDVITQQAFLDGADMALTPKEFALLYYLMRRTEKGVPQEALYEAVWKQPLAGDVGALKSAISRLRGKLAGSGYTIVARRGEGYRFIAKK